MSTEIKEFHDYILYDIMNGIEGVTSKRMFGGYGLYLNGYIFSIITSGSEIYFKVDDVLKNR